MASPQSTGSNEDNVVNSKKNLEQITFRFCSECSNMLYPKEDEDSHKLQFTCRTCQYTEEATSTCVFRNVLNNAAGETAGVTQDVGSDPTVRISSSHTPTTSAACCKVVLCFLCSCEIMCGVCGENNAVEMVPPSDVESLTTAATTDTEDNESLFEYPDLDDPSYDLSLADQYEFEYEMEKGNRDEDCIQPDTDVIMV